MDSLLRAVYKLRTSRTPSFTSFPIEVRKRIVGSRVEMFYCSSLNCMTTLLMISCSQLVMVLFAWLSRSWRLLHELGFLALHVCRESRKTALGVYRLIFETDECPSVIYFDFDIDVLYLGVGNITGWKLYLCRVLTIVQGDLKLVQRAAVNSGLLVLLFSNLEFCFPYDSSPSISHWWWFSLTRLLPPPCDH